MTALTDLVAAPTRTLRFPIEFTDSISCRWTLQCEAEVDEDGSIVVYANIISGTCNGVVFGELEMETQLGLEGLDAAHHALDAEAYRLLDAEGGNK